MFLKPAIPDCPFSAEDLDAIIVNLLNNIATTSHSLTLVDNHITLKAMPGAIIASPSLPANHFSQSYFFHWVRDSAIVIAAICDLYVSAKEVSKKSTYREIIVNYLSFVEKIQAQPAINGINVLGEPKFNIDGTVWSEKWGRPQLGGAAIQALVLCKITAILNDEGEGALVNKIYNNDANSLLKANLEYCARSWAEDSVNVWEELSGNHFSVRFRQYMALTVGAEVAEKLNDSAAAVYYKDITHHLADVLRKHWNEALGYYFETLNQENQLGGGLDTSVLISLVAGQTAKIEDEFSLTSDRSLSTFYYMRNAFEGLYQINVAQRMRGKKGVFLGRYAQDIYDGNHFIYGNPWFIPTNALASAYYGIIGQLLQGKTINVTFLVQQFLSQVAPSLKFNSNDSINKNHKKFRDLINHLFEEADAILTFVKEHCMTEMDGSRMHMSEQIDRASGEQISARDLSWSYASLLSTIKIREKIVNALEK